MSAESQRDVVFVRYFLGTLPPAEEEELEARYFCDAGLYEELQAAADDLIDDYLSARLSADDRRRFEDHFLKSPRQRRRLELVRAVAERFGRGESHRRVGWSGRRVWPLAAAATIVAGLLVVRAGKAPVAPQTAQSETPVPAPPATAKPRLERQVVPLPATTGSPVTVALDSGAQDVRFEVPIENRRHPTFDAVLRSPAGDTLWRKTGLTLSAPGLALAVVVPAALLVDDGDYTLHIDGEPLRGAPRRAQLSKKYALRVARGASPQRQSP